MNAMTELNELHLSLNTVANAKKYRQIEFKYDMGTRALWTYMKPSGATCFNPGLLSEIYMHEQELERTQGKLIHHDELHAIDYHVIASKIPGVFNYGGDLALFAALIKAKDRASLFDYAKLCIDGMYPRVVNYNSPLTTISLVQGEALGGGFEFVLTSNVIIAEETSRMGLPEILFNLFPGMGAYSFLTRRIGAKKAEEMILGGKIYEAGELHEMGIVDVIAPHGQGENAVYEFIRNNSKRANGMRAIYECRQHTHPVTYEELIKITEVWVDAALRLEEKDLKMIGRLVRAQLRQKEARETVQSNQFNQCDNAQEKRYAEM